MKPKLLTLKNLGQSGFNTDQPPWELGPEFFTEGRNVRVRNGKVFPFGGSKQVLQPPIGGVTAGYLLNVHIAQGDFWVMGAADGVYAVADQQGWFDASTNLNINIGDDTVNQWTGCQLGQTVTMNHPEVGPVAWDNSSVGQMKELPFSPGVSWQDLGYTCRAMRSHKNFLIALNVSDPVGSPNTYRISHPADANSLPFTWDTQPRDSIAVRAQLGADGGVIIDGRSLRDAFVVYSQDSIDVLSFNPSSEFFWKRRELSSTYGLLNINCLTEVKGTHFLIVDGDVVTNNGTDMSSVMYGRIQQRFNAGANEFTQDNSFMTRNDALKEVWICVPEDESETANIAYVYNWKDNSWSIKDLPVGTVSADYGADPFSVDLTENPQTWDKLPVPPDPDAVLWSNITRTWGSSLLTALDDNLMGLLNNGVLMNIDPLGAIDDPGLDCVVERVDYPLDGHLNFNTITRLYPHAEGGDFTIQVGSQPYAGGSVTWYPEQVFDPANQRKIDVRVTGQTLCWRVKSIDTNRFTFSGMDIEYSQAGVR